MDVKTYLAESEKTEKKFPEGMKVDSGLHSGMISMFEMIQYCGFLVDVFKRHMIYDKPIDQLGDKISKNLEGLERAQMALNDLYPTTIFKTVDQDRAEVFHALLGLVSEMAEVIEIVVSYLQGEEMDVKHLSDELADLAWYQNILFRKFGIDPEDGWEKNIAKLKVRYPEKFTNEAALNRDLEKESEVL